MSELNPQLFQSFVQTLPLAACLVDLQGKIIYWNGSAEALTGYHSHEVLGRSYREDLLVELKSDHSGTGTVCPVTRVLRNGTPLAADLFLRHQQGHRLPVKVYAFALRSAGGAMAGVGQVFLGSQPGHQTPQTTGHYDREFEWATGLPALEICRTHLHQAAPNSVLYLIEMSEQQRILKHGGALMLHQAIRVLAKTVSALLPPNHFVGCWTDWRLMAVVPPCSEYVQAHIKECLSAVGSSCAVKWWGDRVTIGIRDACRVLPPGIDPISVIHALESDLALAAIKEE